MNVLKTEDILRLSLVQCKLCAERLRYPIMTVPSIGTICGSCYDKNIHCVATRYHELEALFANLHFPCNYAKNGCTVDGIFEDICHHEVLCCFRNKYCLLELCPLNCGKNLTSTDEFIEHMKIRHSNNVITVTAGSISVENPNESRLNKFYLVIANGMHFVLRAEFDEVGQQILYQLYCLNYDIGETKVTFSIELQPDSPFISGELRMTRLRKGEFPCTLDVKNANKIKLDVLRNCNSLNNVIIGVKIKDSKIDDHLQPVGTEYNSTPWFRCAKCSGVFQEVNVCACHKFMCVSCAVTTRCQHQFLIPEHASKATYLCNNRNCRRPIEASQYNAHCQFQCKFRNFICTFVEDKVRCQWKDLAVHAAGHLRNQHSNVLNMTDEKIVTLEGSTLDSFFLKEDDIFRQLYSMNKDGQLTIKTMKLFEPDFCDKYVWQLTFQHPIKKYRTVVSYSYTHYGCKISIDVKDYLIGDKFTFQVFFMYTAVQRS